MASALLTACVAKTSTHPTIYVKDADRGAILEKIDKYDWASKSYKVIKSKVDPYADKHRYEPDWITSRLSMYWKEGERYTQCYVNSRQDWDYGEGNAPVPTVRLPGMRRWNDFKIVPLEDRLPYNESGDMLGISRSSGDPAYVRVPYKETGHMVRYNNLEILELAENAAFLYWLDKDEKYAKFASDIFWTWMLGTYYMQPPLDPGKATKGPGGYEPGGIMGYYDYEQIHDDTQIKAAVIYDFLYDYLIDNPHEHLKTINKNTVEVASTVFKRFIDLGLVRGGKQGNWNVNGFKNIINSMLVLESNDYYEDGKGKEYYIPYYTEITTDYHEALPDIMKIWDEKTGLWPESPGYASGMIPAVFDMGMKLYNNGINTMDGNPMILKAVLANLNWLDARGNLVVFGDMRGGPLGCGIFEDVLAYYTKEGDAEGAKKMTSIIKNAIQQKQYSRDNLSWKGICLYQPLGDAPAELPFKQSVYSERHRHIIQKNGNDIENGMMFTLYGGAKGSHLSANGLAMQFYGKGWALGAKSAAYESYWSKDFKYFSGTTGSNTILPGYEKGDITLNAIDPAIGDNGFYNTTVTSENCSFADVSASEKRRLVAMVRTSEKTGYYVDIFRSNQSENDYLHHNVGDNVQLLDKNKQYITSTEGNDLNKNDYGGYAYFENPQKATWDKDFIARWTVDRTKPGLITDMWMLGGKNRSIYKVDAPPLTLRDDITPGAVNKSPQTTPTLIVRQNSNAKQHPFVAVFEPYYLGEGAIVNVSSVVKNKANLTVIKVESAGGLIQHIVSATDDRLHPVAQGFNFEGIFGIASLKNGGLDYLYLGKGKSIEKGFYKIASATGKNISAELRKVNGKYYYSSDRDLIISLPNGTSKTYDKGYDIEIK